MDFQLGGGQCPNPCVVQASTVHKVKQLISDEHLRKSGEAESLDGGLSHGETTMVKQPW